MKEQQKTLIREISSRFRIPPKTATKDSAEAGYCLLSSTICGPAVRRELRMQIHRSSVEEIKRPNPDFPITEDFE